MALFNPSRFQGTWIGRHSLSLVLAAILVAQTLYAIWAGSNVFMLEQPFGKAVEVWSYKFWIWWTWEYNVSLVADTYGVLLIVLLSKWLTEQGSSEG